MRNIKTQASMMTDLIYSLTEKLERSDTESEQSMTFSKNGRVIPLDTYERAIIEDNIYLNLSRQKRSEICES